MVPIERCARQLRVIAAAVVRYGGRQSCYRIFGGALPTLNLSFPLFFPHFPILISSRSDLVPRSSLAARLESFLGDDPKLIGILAHRRLMFS
jgi:hypothetical protein